MGSVESSLRGVLFLLLQLGYLALAVGVSYLCWARIGHAVRTLKFVP